MQSIHIHTASKYSEDAIPNGVCLGLSRSSYDAESTVSLSIQSRKERRGIRYQIIAADLEDRKGIVRDDVQ